jgi:U3 small nucleolar RNA-associated protein 14
LPLIEDIERGLVACKVHDEDVRWMAEVVQREIRKASRERTDKIVADMYRKLKKEGKI